MISLDYKLDFVAPYVQFPLCHGMLLLQCSLLNLTVSQQVKLKPDYGIAHSNLGHAHQELGEMKEAELHYREALKLDWNHTLTKFRLAKLISDVPPLTVPRLLEADAL